jgi:predicted acylesterase/phospholipase RssA
VTNDQKARTGNVPVRLGLALSGGGFRASFFHLGVLKRLAELDLLRLVNVLSTVSGGSVVGALYYWKLKGILEANGGKLSRQDYIDLVRHVGEVLRKGVSTDPRDGLFYKNPIGSLESFIYGLPLGWRMARIYKKQFFRPLSRNLGDPLELNAVKMDLSGMARHMDIPGRMDIERFNARVTPKDHMSFHEEKDERRNARVPKLVVNSTCLNTGGPFTFTFSEVGEPELGYIRFDEADLVLAFKQLTCGLTDAGKFKEDKVKNSVADVMEAAGRSGYEMNQKWILPVSKWWSAMEKKALSAEKAEKEPAIRWLEYLEPLGKEEMDFLEKLEVDGIAVKLWQAPFVLLRDAKEAVKELIGLQKPVDGQGLERDFLIPKANDQLKRAFQDIQVGMEDNLADITRVTGISEDFRNQFFLSLYFMRSARAFSCDVKKVLNDLDLPQAVAASANFPPVFDPFKIYRFYDHQKAQVLCLTDGGVYDNQGMMTLLAEECTHLILSDAGSGLQEDPAPSDNRLPMLASIVNILMNNVGVFQREIVHLRAQFHQATIGSTLSNWSALYPQTAFAYFNMDSDIYDAEPAEALPPHPLARDIADMRTDLNAFDDYEVNALIYQGYQLGDRFVRRYLDPGQTILKTDPLSNPKGNSLFPEGRGPDFLSQEERQLEKKIILSGKTLFRLPGLWSWLFGAMGFCFLSVFVWAICNGKASFEGVVLGLGGWIGAFLQKPWIIGPGAYHWDDPVLELVVLFLICLPLFATLLEKKYYDWVECCDSIQLGKEPKSWFRLPLAPFVFGLTKRLVWWVLLLPIWFSILLALVAFLLHILDGFGRLVVRVFRK